MANIFLCGVGGQGVLLFSEILAKGALLSGYKVKKSEVHGMAQRGGSVISMVRYGKEVFSPLIDEGGASHLVAFEKLEALRYLSYLSPVGTIIMSTQRIDPLPVAAGLMEYPEGIEEKIKAYTPFCRMVDGLSMAKELGNLKVINTILLGVLSAFINIPPTNLQRALFQLVPPHTKNINEKAFKMGQTYSR